ncbi:MAG: metalloregulator ArsR/SmtB family transcription factor [Clostridia bacterium]
MIPCVNLLTRIFVEVKIMAGKFLLLEQASKQSLEKFMPQDSRLQAMANFFAVFSDPTRLKIISALSVCSLCVNDLCEVLKINQTTLSHQLKCLKSEKIVSSVRAGKIIVYQIEMAAINDTMLAGVKRISEKINI